MFKSISWRLLIRVLALAGGLSGIIGFDARCQQLTSGVPVRFNVSAANPMTLYTGFSVAVPAGSTRLE